ncbi:hypothetical protein [Bradyrhizobium jicamae]|uniref:hypothetical protein n=1 Tax=Bradyrhizobium jicamae TaxID=280332 RepID=UPI001BA6DA6B|nr:hypothetical protein [Bradyrhizobium jicamae]MBR0937301.1 hypothetical protein [Bradyrhizobium jicamae]
MIEIPNIVASMEHPGLFRTWFDGASWNGWKSIAKATNGLPMSPADVAFFKSVAGGREPPKRRPREIYVLGGRRAGKDSYTSGVAAHTAASFNPRGILRPGERAVVVCVAVDKDQGRIIWNYCRAFFERIKPFSAMVTRLAESDNIIELCNQVDVIVMSGARPAALRGRPILLAVLDECAHFQSGDGATSDSELHAAILPSMATIPQAQLIGISTPHRRDGLLFNQWRRYFGRDTDDVVVIQAASHVLNPSLDTRDRDRQLQEDPARAQAEWFALWRDDLVSFIDPATVDRAVVAGRIELPPSPGIQYTAGVDPSGGSSDSMTLAIAHADGERGILDLVREWKPPFSPDLVCREIAEICRRYGTTTVLGDNYGGEWPKERFRAHGIDYQLAGKSRSDLYLTLLPALNTPGRIELLDHKRLTAQLCGLERRTTRSGKDSVDHPSGGHDDVINAAAIALVGAALAPQGAAWGWLEYMRRECIKAGLDPDRLPNTDYDDVRAPAPDWGWRF